MTGSLGVRGELTDRLTRELRAAADGFDAGRWAAIVSAAAVQAAKDTVAPKARLIGRVACSVGGTIRRLAQEGPGACRPMAGEALAVVRAGVSARVAAARDVIRYASGDRASVIAWVAGVVAFVVAAGGADLEGGLPDTDLAFGVDAHRNPFSHTVLAGLGLEFSLRFAALVVEALMESLPVGHHPVWLRVASTARVAGRGAFIGMWLGLGAHLLDDASLLSGSTKPYVGLPSMSMGAHQTLFAANAAGAATFAAAGVSDSDANEREGQTRQPDSLR